MKIFRYIVNFYLDSSIHVAFAVFALTWVSLILCNLSYNEGLLFFIFFSTITGYNFVKYFGAARFHHRRLAKGLRMIQLFSLTAFIAMCYYALQLSTSSLLLLGVLGIITFLYAIPMVPIKYILDDQKKLREISGLKIYVIAIVWTFTTVV